MGLWKLEHHSDTRGWVVRMNRLSLDLYTCPICKQMFCNPQSRFNHEISHQMPTYTNNRLRNCLGTTNVPVSDLSTSAEQQEFLINVELIKVNPKEQDAIDRLAHRRHLIDAFKIFGNAIGEYNCHHCTYEIKLD